MISGIQQSSVLSITPRCHDRRGWGDGCPELFAANGLLLNILSSSLILSEIGSGFLFQA